MRELTRDQARRVAVRAQLLTADRPADLMSAAEHLTLLQLDPTAVVAPTAELVVWTRVGNGFTSGELRRAAEVDKSLFEYRGVEDPSTGNIAMLRPMSMIGLYLAEMAELRARPGQVRTWLDANAGFERRVIDQLRSEGPLSSKDIPDTAEVPWQSTGWTGGRNVTQLLEFLASRGVVAVAGRNGTHRLWDLAERVYPVDTEVVPLDEALRARNEARLRALGIARTKYVGDAGIPVTVVGTQREWRLDPGADIGEFQGRTALLSPFDRLIHNRERSLDLFDFEFMIELYKPKAKRRWGYYALPVLHGDRLIGKVDLTGDRKQSMLDVHQIHEDIPWTKTIKRAVEAEPSSLAAWIGRERVRMP